METSNFYPDENLHDDASKQVGINNSEHLAADASAESSINEMASVERPLPKIHPHLHPHGKYKMFSNHSSSNDIPKTSTGI